MDIINSRLYSSYSVLLRALSDERLGTDTFDTVNIEAQMFLNNYYEAQIFLNNEVYSNFSSGVNLDAVSALSPDTGFVDYGVMYFRACCGINPCEIYKDLTDVNSIYFNKGYIDSAYKSRNADITAIVIDNVRVPLNYIDSYIYLCLLAIADSIERGIYSDDLVIIPFLYNSDFEISTYGIYFPRNISFYTDLTSGDIKDTTEFLNQTKDMIDSFKLYAYSRYIYDVLNTESVEVRRGVVYRDAVKFLSEYNDIPNNTEGMKEYIKDISDSKILKQANNAYTYRVSSLVALDLANDLNSRINKTGLIFNWELF